MKALLRSLVGIGCLAALGPLSAKASGHVAPPDTLATAEVTAPRPAAAVRSTVPTQQLTAAEMALRGVTDTGDALRRLAGVNLRDYGGAGGLKTVSVRGMGATHTTVAVDGLPLNEARGGQTDMNRFAIESVEAMELTLLDPGSLLCPVRLAAAAAVLRLTTWQPDTLSPRPHLRAGLTQGSWQTWSPTLFASLPLTRRQQLSASAHYAFSENDYPFYVDNGRASQRLHRTNSRLQRIDSRVGHLLLLPHGGRVETAVSLHHSHQRLPGQVTLYVYDNDERLDEQDVEAWTRWSQRRGRLQAYAAGKFGYSRSKYADYDAQYPGGALREHYRRRHWYGSAGLQWDVWPWLSVATAGDVERTTLQSNQQTDNDVGRTEWLQSLSVEVHRRRFSLTARGLMHHYRHTAQARSTARSDTHFDPTLRVGYTLTEGRVRLMARAAVKRSFRLPTFTESYYHHSGDVNLRPERALQTNLGLTMEVRGNRLLKACTLTVDGYINRVKDRIQTFPLNIYLWRTTNLGRADLRGLDATARLAVSPAKGHELVMTGNYSYLCAADKTDPASTAYGRQAPYTPRHSGAASAAWENPWLCMALHTTCASERWSTPAHIATTRLAPYTDWGVALYRSFRLGRWHCRVRGDLLNMFNHRYDIVRNYPMPGRSYRLTLSASL